ncbi:MAG: transcriptional regulator [Anditalea sp.]
MKTFALLMVLSIAGVYRSFGQVQFTQRMEIETAWEEDDFIILQRDEGLVAFRMVSEKGMNRDRSLQYFISDFQLNPGELKNLPVKDFLNLLGFDLDGDLLYVLFQKGEAPTSEKLIVEIDLSTGDTAEIPVNAILGMELQEFFVLDKQAILMGNLEYRPAIQVYNTTTQRVITIQGIYEKDAKIIQMRKAPEFGGFDVLMSRRDRYKNKIVSISSFDTKGTKLKEVKIDHLSNADMEIIEGVLTPSISYTQALIGPYGIRRRETLHGLYFTQINEFGEFESNLYNLSDFDNFYNYLPEKSKNRRIRKLERAIAKGKSTPIRNTLSTREIIAKNGYYLIYNDLFASSSRKYMSRNGMYINNFYRMSPRAGNIGGGGGYNSPLWTNPYMRSGQISNEYKFLSAQMILMDENGKIVWDNALSLDNTTRIHPGKFGEVSFDGHNLYYMYVDELELKLSQIKNGEVVLENESFELELINENERIRDTQENSLNLMWWYQDYYLLSGKQEIRYQKEDGREDNREVFFLTKIKVEDLN